MNDAKQIGENWVYKGDSLIFMVTEPKPQPKASAHAAELNLGSLLAGKLCRILFIICRWPVKRYQYQEIISEICDMDYLEKLSFYNERGLKYHYRVIDYIITGMLDAPVEEPACQAEGDCENRFVLL